MIRFLYFKEVIQYQGCVGKIENLNALGLIPWGSGVTRHLSHKTRHEIGFTRTRRDKMFWLKKSSMKYIGEKFLIQLKNTKYRKCW